MLSFPPPSWRDGDFERVVFALGGGPGSRLLEATDDFAIWLTSPGRIAVIFRGSSDAALLRPLLKRWVRSAEIELALIGGDDASRKRAKKAIPFYTPKAVQLYQFGDDRKPWRWRSKRLGSTPAWDALLALQRGELADPNWAVLIDSAQQEEINSRASREEAQRFLSRVQSGKPFATWSIVALVIVVGLIEFGFGAFDSPPALIRLGALYAPLLKQGEWWRLLSPAFLHGGWLHLLLNSYVLLILGSSLEGWLGRSRFLVLYWLAAIAGSVASMSSSTFKLSVGASGALWGLLGAQAMLAFRKGYLPEALVARARQVAVSNLVLNVMVSFQANVDASAHFGGGIAGALLFGSGLLTMGLPRADQIGNHEPTQPRWIAPAAILLSAAAVLSLGLATIGGGVNKLGEPPKLVRRSIPALEVSVALPEQLALHPGKKKQTEFNAGDIMTDAAMIGLEIDRGKTAESTTLEEIRKALNRVEPNSPFTARAAPSEVVIGDRTGLLKRSRAKNGLLLDHAIVFAPGGLIKVDVLSWPAYGAAWKDVAVEVLRSVELDPPSR